MEELEEVLRSSEEERRRLEEERAKEEELLSKALAITDGAQAEAVGKSSSVGTADTSATEADGQTRNAQLANDAEKATAKQVRENSEAKPTRAASAKREKRDGFEEEVIFREGRPPTSKRPSSQERRASLKSATKEGKPSTEGRKRKDETGKKTASEEEEQGLMQGPRTKNVYDVNALLQEPSRLNSATVRSREEYLRMQRDRLLAMKASEREKQMNVGERASKFIDLL
ncbi:unnamed protein product [Strongylus vulgaris]|uniref:Uncharacterized protein n=1 Tax=Strongylus vulgaris TaxID=40348 RepID=A0A3P7LJL3_STRVU|nr:unnamed protein product [Strongylus vulgaris]